MARARRGAKPRLGELKATAKLHYTRVGPRKVRAVADLIRGLTVDAAQNQLAVLHRPSAVPLLVRLLKSALSNASLKGESFNAGELIIGEIFVDGGPTTTRFQPRAMGRAAVIRKRTSHVTVRLYSHP